MTTTPLDPSSAVDEIDEFDEIDEAAAVDDADDFDDAVPTVFERSRVERFLPWLLTLGGGVGLAASFELTIDKIRLLQDPSYVPACSVNAVVSCSQVMKSDEASLFGFPNSLIGIASFSVMVTLGVLMLAGVSLPIWVRRGMIAGAALGVIFCHWLAFNTLYRIGALCPYCMAVWSVTIPIFWTLVVAEVRRVGRDTALSRAVVAHPVLPIVVWFAVMGSLIFVRFSDFWLGNTPS